MRTLLLLFLACAAARAEYALPTPEEVRTLLAEDWKIRGERLEVRHGGETYAWDVDWMFLADRIDSVSICTGGYQRKMRAYVRALPQGALRVELVKLSGSFAVSGLWPCDEKAAAPLREPSDAAWRAFLVERIQADLEFKLERDRESPLVFRFVLRNRGERARAVVRPGDGSGEGWREPHVRLSAEVPDGKGGWKALEPRVVPRCGLYDADWGDDVVTLEPGGSLEDYAPAPLDVAFDLRGAKQVRVRAHYDYAAGKNGRAPAEPPAAMAGVPPFSLVSEPLVIDL